MIKELASQEEMNAGKATEGKGDIPSNKEGRIVGGRLAESGTFKFNGNPYTFPTFKSKFI